MRCESCNEVLTPYEDSIVGVKTGNRLGLCSGCLNDLRGLIDFAGDPLARHYVEDDDADPPINTWGTR